VRSESAELFLSWAKWYRLAEKSALPEDQYHTMRTLLARESRRWPSGLGEAVLVRIGLSLLDEFAAIGKGTSHWSGSALAMVGHDLLSFEPPGLGLDTARLLAESALTGSLRAQAVLSSFPGGPSWAYDMLERSHRVSLARDTWDQKGFAQLQEDLGWDPRDIPVGWFGLGRERANTVEALGLLTQLPPCVAETASVLIAEWEPDPPLGAVLDAAAALSRQ